jgi:hypothetical protein
MSFTIDENAVQQVSDHNSGGPAYTVTALNLDISSELLSPPAAPSYGVFSTVALPTVSPGAEHEDLGFGTHIREAVGIVKEWVDPAR